jgi:DNA-binding NarL/FixJ family response regulator
MRIVLVEDHVAYRESFRVALSALTPHVVVGEVGRARDAYDLLERTRPDLAVVDFLLPDSDAVSLARELRRRRLYTPVMILGRIAHPRSVRDAMHVGVRGYTLKRQPLADIIGAIEKVGAGETYLGPGLGAGSERQGDAGETALDRLSVREREILWLLSEGLTSKEIGRALYLSSKTVDAHRLHINRKLGVNSPAELARVVAGEGILAG